MNYLTRFNALISQRFSFAVIYLTVSMAVGMVNAWYLDAIGFNPVQLLTMMFVGLLASLADGSFFSSRSALDPELGEALKFWASATAPFLLIYLAAVRGRRISRRFLVTFPIAGAVIMLIGALPFIGMSSPAAVFLFLPWIFDGLCLYHGAWRKAESDAR